MFGLHAGLLLPARVSGVREETFRPPEGKITPAACAPQWFAWHGTTCIAATRSLDPIVCAEQLQADQGDANLGRGSKYPAPSNPRRAETPQAHWRGSDTIPGRNRAWSATVNACRFAVDAWRSTPGRPHRAGIPAASSWTLNEPSAPSPYSTPARGVSGNHAGGNSSPRINNIQRSEPTNKVHSVPVVRKHTPACF